MAAITGLIPIEDRATLISASEAKSKAEGAVLAQQLAKVAYNINTAVNAGQYNVKISEPLLPETIDTLEENGYSVAKVGIAQEKDIYAIDWSW